MNLGVITLSEITQTQKDKYCRSHSCVESKNIRLKEAKKKILIFIAKFSKVIQWRRDCICNKL
jgi:hypothetical protein